MKCAHCGGSAQVMTTRGTKRRRQCDNGHSFWTDEVVLPDVVVVVPKAERMSRARFLEQQVAQREGIKSLAVAVELGTSDAYVRRIRQRIRNRGTSDGHSTQARAQEAT